MAEYEHWKNCMDTPYLGAYSLGPNEELVLTIREVKRERVVATGGKTDFAPVAYFSNPNIKPMVLNATNCKIIAKNLKTDNIYEWAGKKIQVYATTTIFGRETVPCLRVKPFVPTSDEVEYKCSVCGKSVTYDTYRKSIAKYGKAYCSGECYNKDTKGVDVLAEKDNKGENN